MKKIAYILAITLTSVCTLYSFDVDQALNDIEMDYQWKSGPKDNRVTLVISNRGPDNGDFSGKADFVTMFNENIKSAFTPGHENEQQPFAQYRNFFNLATAWWPNAPADDGTVEGWNWPDFKAIRDRTFLPWSGDYGWVTYMSTVKHGGGGGAGRVPEKRVGDAKIFGMDHETVLHEFSHTMPQIGDEYTSSGEWSNFECRVGANTMPYTDKEKIPWRAWIEETTPLPTPYDKEHEHLIGAFRGGGHNYFGCYRPTARGCFMGAGGFGKGYGENLCPVCMQRVITQIYKYVNPIETYTPVNKNFSVSGNQVISFSVETIKPEPNTQEYQWIVNGKVVEENTESFELEVGFCDSYEVVFLLTDKNPKIRHDPPFVSYPQKEVRWNIIQSDISSYDLSAQITPKNATCSGKNDGQASVSVTGGTAPYEIIWDNNPDIKDNELSAGSHNVKIFDSNGCAIEKTVSIGQNQILSPEISSILHTSNSWSLTTNIEGYDMSELDFEWSTGTITPSVLDVSDGSYWLKITTGNGCSVTEEITLVTPDRDLSIDPIVIQKQDSNNLGMIILNAAGGRKPYYFRWNDGNQFSDRKNLDTGEYHVVIKDANKTTIEQSFVIESINSFQQEKIHIKKKSNYLVTVDNPSSTLRYFWFEKKDDIAPLHIGDDFQPPDSGTFYIAAQRLSDGALSTTRKGFAVTMDTKPVVSIDDNGLMTVTDPKDNEEYYWYETALGGDPVHTGITYQADYGNYYYITSRTNPAFPAPLDPGMVTDGMVLWMDASDLNGDGSIDFPQPDNASNYEWIAKVGDNRWERPNSWFAFEKDVTNGLGAANFATIWYQGLANNLPNFKTMIMVYKENELSWEGTAPFNGLSHLIPKAADGENALFANNVSNAVLQGKTYLNGEQVDPMITANPMEFMVLTTDLSTTWTNGERHTDSHWEGYLAEMIFWNRSLNNDERSGIEEFLRQKWISIAHLESPRAELYYGDDEQEDEINEQPDNDNITEAKDEDQFNEQTDKDIESPENQESNDESFIYDNDPQTQKSTGCGCSLIE